jgi:thiamine-phosphate pyrophosphorylase
MEDPQKILRIVDVNLNRLGEGLRFLEEVSRFILDDTKLTQQLKNLRHDLVRTDIEFDRRLLEARDSEGDVGIDLEVPGESKEKGLPRMVVANSRRAQESLRVLEEMAKLPDINLDSDKYKHARFALYTIEKELLAKMGDRARSQK